jgi:hypothetical protein
MENDKTVEQRLAMLAPPAGWVPDTAAALRRHHARRQHEWRRGPAFWWKLAVAAAVLLAVAVIPPTRGLAQRLWNLLKVGRVEVLRIDFDRLPENSLRADILVSPGDAVPMPRSMPSAPASVSPHASRAPACSMAIRSYPSWARSSTEPL